MRKLILIIANILIIATIICLAINLTISAPVMNDIYIDQLNGGNAEYIEMQAYQTYKNNSNNLKATIAGLSTTLIIINVASFVGSRKK